MKHLITRTSILLAFSLFGCGNDSNQVVSSAQYQDCLAALESMNATFSANVQIPDIDCTDASAMDDLDAFIESQMTSLQQCQIIVAELVEITNGNIQSSDFDCEFPETLAIVQDILEEKRQYNLRTPQLLSFGYELAGNRDFTISWKDNSTEETRWAISIDKISGSCLTLSSSTVISNTDIPNASSVGTLGLYTTFSRGVSHFEGCRVRVTIQALGDVGSNKISDFSNALEISL